jgi:hypothetical protein
MGIAVLLIVSAAAVFTVLKGKLGALFSKFSKPISAQPVFLVSPKGATLWQRTASFIVGALIVAVPAVLLLKQTGEHHDPVTNYYAPTVTSTTFPAMTAVVTPQSTAGGNR